MSALCQFDYVRIAAEMIGDPRTVRRVYRGQASVNMRLRVQRAAEALGYPAPPPVNPKDANAPAGQG